MFKIVIFFFVTAAAYSTSWARITDNQVEIKTKSKEIQVTTKKGFHLNAEAPAGIQLDNTKKQEPPSVKKSELFIFNLEAGATKAEINFYVCDDKKTVCELHRKSINLKSGAITQEKTKTNYNNVADFKLKSENGKPTLLVFSAPWCPACIRMQTETYSKKNVQELLKKVNFVKLNSDVVDNYEMSEKFGIQAIPTMILLDKNGTETFRWLDFFSADDFARELKTQLGEVNNAETLVMNAKLGDEKSASILGFKAYNALNFEEALKWFSLTKNEKNIKYKLSSEVMFAKESSEGDKKTKTKYSDVLQKAIVLTTSELDRIRWSIDYIELKKSEATLNEETKAKARQLISRLDSLLKSKQKANRAFELSTYGNYGGFEKIEILWLKGKIYELLDLKAEKQKANSASIAEIAKKNLSVERPGEALLAIAYLREAEETKKVTDLYEKLIKRYPNTYVYFEKYARFMQKNKNNEKAISLVNEALKFPEGNEPQLVLLRSQILRDLNKNEEALLAIEAILQKSYIQHKRFSRTVKRLSELKEEIRIKN